MADVCARALQKRLRNDALPWKQRLTLGKKAFLSKRLEKVENIDVIVTDWIIDIINNQEISVESEKHLMKSWKFLFSILKELKRRRKDDNKISLRKGICVTSSFLNTVLQWIEHLPSCQNETLVEIFLSCATLLVELNAFEDILMRNVEEYVLLISGLLSTVNSSECWKQEIRTEAKRLLFCVLKIKQRFINYGQYDQIKIFVKTYQSLFIPAISVLRFLDAESNKFDVDLGKNIKRVVGSLLFHPDLAASFGDVFAAIFNDEGGIECPEYFVEFLCLIQKHAFEVVEPSSTYYGYLLLFLFERFCENYKKISSTVMNQFLIILFRLLGINCSSVRLNSPGVFKLQNEEKLEYVLQTRRVPAKDNDYFLLNIAILLEGCISSLVLTDNEAVHLPFFKNLADFLLSDIKCRSSSWYRCIQLLLSANPLIFVPQKIGLLLKNLYLDAPIDSKTVQIRDNIFCKLLDVYAKLQQIPKLISKLLLNFSDMNLKSVHGNLLLSKCVLDRFAEICSTIYPQLVVELWSNLQDYILQKLHVTDGLQSVDNLRRIHPAIDLLKSLISCSRIVDRNLPKETFLAITELLDSTSRMCFKKLIENALEFDNLPLLHNSLQLVYVWGELNISLLHYNSQYAKIWHRNHSSNYDTKTLKFDFSIVHDCIDVDDWERLYVVCQKSENLQLKHTFLLLILQKLKALNVFSDSERPGWMEQQQLASLENFTENKISVASWALICNVLPTLAVTMTLKDFYFVAKMIVSTSTTKKESIMESSSELSLVTNTLLECREFHDTAIFHTAIVTACLEEMSTTITSLSDGNNKILMKTTKILKAFFKKPEMWLQSANSGLERDVEPNEMWSVVIKGAKAFSKVLILCKKNYLLETSTPGVSLSVSCFLEFLNLIERLPLEYFFPENQMRCLFQVFSILCITSESVYVSQDEAQVVVIALRIMKSLFDGVRSIWLFKFVRATDVLLFYVGPFMTLLKKISDCCEFEIVQEVQQLSMSLLGTLVDYAIKDSLALKDCENFVEEVKVFPCWKMQLNLPSDCLTVVSALTILKSFHNVTKKSLSEIVSGHCERLLKDFYCWFAVIQENRSALMDKPKFVELLVSFLEAFVICLKGKKHFKWTKNAIPFEIDEFNQEYIPNIVNFIVEILETDNNFMLHEALCSFLSTVTRNLQELRPLLPNNVFETVWNLSNRYFVIDNQIHKIIESVIEKSSDTEFSWLLKSLLSDLTIDVLTTGNLSQIETALLKWSIVLKFGVTDDKQILLKDNIGKFLIHCHHVLGQPLARTRITAIVLDIDTDIIRSLTSQDHLLLLLHTSSIVNLDMAESHDVFVRHFHAIYKIFNNMILYQRNFVEHVIVTFISSVQHLIHSVMAKSQQNLMKKCTDDHLSEICECARDVERLLTQMSKLEGGFAKLAPFLIADFVTQSTKFVLHPPVKNSLTVGIYAVMSLCHPLDFSSLFTALTKPGCELLNILHTNYKKYYCYTGKV